MRDGGAKATAERCGAERDAGLRDLHGELVLQVLLLVLLRRGLVLVQLVPGLGQCARAGAVARL